MPQIVPIRDLKDTNAICELVQKSNEPLFVTKNGYGAMVLMSMETYDRNFATVEVRRLLKEAEDEVESGAELLDADTVFKTLREKHGK